MILRRVIEHVRTQNWFAVFLDFIIVVVGVFIGMQVQGWYAEQDRVVADKIYMERLYQEVSDLLAIRSNILLPRRQNYIDLQSASDKIFADVAEENLTLEECAAVQLSHIFVNPTTDLPTMDELLSSGRLDTLSSARVRDAVLQYAQSSARGSDVIEAVNAGVLVLSRKFPDLIKLDASDARKFGLILESPHPTCDLQGMRTDRSFMNDLADNKSRFDTYYLSTLEEPTERLRALHVALAAELSLANNHSEGAD